MIEAYCRVDEMSVRPDVVHGVSRERSKRRVIAAQNSVVDNSTYYSHADKMDLCFAGENKKNLPLSLPRSQVGIASLLFLDRGPLFGNKFV